jgi:hypothetical protein
MRQAVITASLEHGAVLTVYWDGEYYGWEVARRGPSAALSEGAGLSSKSLALLAGLVEHFRHQALAFTVSTP